MRLVANMQMSLKMQSTKSYAWWQIKKIWCVKIPQVIRLVANMNMCLKMQSPKSYAWWQIKKIWCVCLQIISRKSYAWWHICNVNWYLSQDKIPQVPRLVALGQNLSRWAEHLKCTKYHAWWRIYKKYHAFGWGSDPPSAAPGGELWKRYLFVSRKSYSW